MIELIILYVLKDREYTMYGVRKRIMEYFSPYTCPSFGSIRPTLQKLTKKGFVNCREYMSEGGRHSCFYTRTEKGLQELKRLMMEPLTYNPVQFLSSASIKLFCTDILDKKQKTEMFLSLKASATKFMNLAQGILDDEYTPKDFYQNIILNNTICELKNIITIIENFEKE